MNWNKYTFPIISIQSHKLEIKSKSLSYKNWKDIEKTAKKTDIQKLDRQAHNHPATSYKDELHISSSWKGQRVFKRNG